MIQCTLQIARWHFMYTSKSKKKIFDTCTLNGLSK